MSTRDTIKSILRTARRHATRAAVVGGVPALRQRLTGRRHLILMFHRIRPTGKPLDPFDTCPSHSLDVFLAMLDYVTGRFQVVSLGELAARRDERSPLAAITFDDGWRDTYDLAFPVLKKLNLPATVFLTTGKIGSTEPFWQQILGSMFRRAADRNTLVVGALLGKVLGSGTNGPFTSRLYRETVARWKEARPSQRDEQLGALATECPDEAGRPRCFLNTAEIREMAAAGIEFGSHTVNHALLDRCAPAQMEAELAESKAHIETIVGQAVESLAYPNGDYSNQVVDTARTLGYRVGCTVRCARVGVQDDPLLLPRVEPEWDVAGSAQGSFGKRQFEWTAR